MKCHQCKKFIKVSKAYHAISPDKFYFAGFCNKKCAEKKGFKRD